MKSLLILLLLIISMNASYGLEQIKLEILKTVEIEEIVGQLPSNWALIKRKDDPRIERLEKLFDQTLSKHLEKNFIIYHRGKALGRAYDGIKENEVWVLFDDEEEVYPFGPQKLSLTLIPKTEKNIFIVVKYDAELFQEWTPNEDSID